MACHTALAGLRISTALRCAYVEQMKVCVERLAWIILQGSMIMMLEILHFKLSCREDTGTILALSMLHSFISISFIYM